MEVTEQAAGDTELDAQRIGREIFAGLADQHPSVFNSDYWQGHVLQWAMRDEAFKVQLFRFVDVFPALRDPDAVARHLQEYFDHPSGELPAVFRWGLKVSTPGHLSTRVVAKALDYNIHAMAQRFIAGRDAAAALPVLRGLRNEHMTFTLDVLGEASLSRAEGEQYQQRYLELLEHLPPQAASWPADPHLDAGPWGEIPGSISRSRSHRSSRRSTRWTSPGPGPPSSPPSVPSSAPPSPGERSSTSTSSSSATAT